MVVAVLVVVLLVAVVAVVGVRVVRVVRVVGIDGVMAGRRRHVDVRMDVTRVVGVVRTMRITMMMRMMSSRSSIMRMAAIGEMTT